MVDVGAQTALKDRIEILKTVRQWDQILGDLKQGKQSTEYDAARQADKDYLRKLEKAKKDFDNVVLDDEAIKNCVKLTDHFGAEGNRGDYIIALAAQACAALKGAKTVTREHIQEVAQLVIHHRRPEFLQSSSFEWVTEEKKKKDQHKSKDLDYKSDEQRVKEILGIEA